LLNELGKLKNSKIVKVDIDNHYSKKLETNSALFAELNNSKFVICAPGRSWTTTRISMAAYFGCVPILCDPDIELIGLSLVDEENCILYPNLRNKTDTERFDIANSLKERLQILSTQNQRLEEIAAKFKSDFTKNHTSHRRAKFIFNKIKAIKI